MVGRVEGEKERVVVEWAGLVYRIFDIERKYP